MSLRTAALLGAAGALALAASAGVAAAAAPAAGTYSYAPGAVLVGYAPGTTAAERAEVRARVRAASAKPLSRLSTEAERVALPRGASVAGAIAALERDPSVRYAEPDWVITRAAESNDPFFTGGSLWGMYGDMSTPANAFGSQAAEAWMLGHTGSRDIAVGVVDEGIDFSHPDLSANAWKNPGETPGNGVDDDKNGYIDDVNGWDFANKDASVYDAGGDAHGTHVSGTIAGVGGNGIGVAGVTWNASLISGKFLGPSGGYISDAVLALDYITNVRATKGVKVVATSNSWGGGGFSQSLLDAINRGGDQGILFIAAAGNSGRSNDSTANYPSNYQCTTRFDTKAARGWDCVIAVAAITSSGSLASYSNYGAKTVDLGAPGSSVLSTTPGNTYASYNGTSMATPHVSGAAALCASITPALTAADIRTHIMSAVAPTTSLSSTTTTGGRLDVGAMAAICAGGTPVAPAPGAFGKSAPKNGATRVSTRPTLSWAASSGAVGYEVCWNTTGASCTSWVSTGTARSTVVSLPGRTRVYWQARALNSSGTTEANTGTRWSFTTR